MSGACPEPAFVLPADAGRDVVCAALKLDEEACARLALYVRELERWNARINLVAPSTLGQAWARHVADGAQLLRHLPHISGARQLIDVGSGSGVPGLVMALAMGQRPDWDGCETILVDSNAKKCAFLRQVAQKAQIHVRILHARVESLTPEELGAGAGTVLLARAFAPLPRLLELTAPFFAAGAQALLLKGRGAGAEIRQAEEAGWRLKCRLLPSVTGGDGCIVHVRRAMPARPG